MSEHDPLLALGGLIDEPVAPRVAFAEALRAQLLAELETNGQPKEKEPHMMNLAAPATIARLPERVKRTRRQRLMTAFEIAAVAAIMIGVIAALSPGRWGRSDPPTPSSNSIQAMVPSASASPEASPQAWQPPFTAVEGIVWKRPVGDDQNLFTYGTASDEDQVYRLMQSDAFTGVEALNGTTGDLIWRFPTVRNWPGTGIAIGDGKLFVTGARSLDENGYPNGALFALNRENGELIWELPLANITSPPIFAEDRLYLNANYNAILAIDASDGSIIWNQQDQSNFWQPGLWLVNDRLYFTEINGDLLSIDIDDPGSTDQVTTSTPMNTMYLPPVIVDNKLIVARNLDIDTSTRQASGGEIVALDQMNANTTLWTRTFDGQIGSPVVLGNALVIAVPSDDGSESVLLRLDPATGETIWTSEVTSAAFEALGTSDTNTPMILAPSAERILYGIDPDTGKRIAAMGGMAVRWMTPSIYGFVVATMADQSIALLLPYPGQGELVEKPTGEPTTTDLPEGVRWEKPLATGLYAGSSTVVVNDVIVRAIASSAFSGLEGIDTSAGQQRWQREYPWTGQITSGDGLVYVPGTTGQGISAIDPATGETRWTSVNMVGNSSFPVFKDGVVYIWSTANILFAVDAETGTSLWQAYMAPDSASSGYVIRSDIGFHTPAVGASVVVTASAGGRLYAFDRTNGEQLWTYDPPDDAWAIRYASSGDTLVLITGSPSDSSTTQFVIEGIDLATGSTLWQTAGFGDLNQIPVITTKPSTGEATVSLIAQEVRSADQVGTPFAIPASNTGIVFMLDVQTGEVVQQSNGTNYTAIASTDDGTGLLLWPLTSRSTNAPLDLGQPIDGVPVNAGETIFVTLKDGTLVAIDGTKFTAG